jgi:cellulose synthase A
MMESGAHHPCAACGDDAHAACRACSYALCRACLDEDVAEGRTACARCAGEYAAFDTGVLCFTYLTGVSGRSFSLTGLNSVPAHAKGSTVEEEEEQEVEDQLAAEGLRGRVTVASQLTDRQVKSLIPIIVQISVAQLEIDLQTFLTMLDGNLLQQEEVSHARTMSSMSGIGSGRHTCLCFLEIFPHLMPLES